MEIHDGRRPARHLIDIYHNGLLQAGWTATVLCDQASYPVCAFLSPAAAAASAAKPVNSLWLLGGVHGEEPAPSEAFANELPGLIKLGQRHSVVLLPLLNPAARDKDWRYENEYRDFRLGKSVTFCDHLLLDGRGQPRMNEAVSATAGQITGWVVSAIRRCPPLLVIDHHEDRVAESYPAGDPRNIRSCYVYVSGEGRATREIAADCIAALKSSGMPVADTGLTRFSEPIENGIVLNTSDGSIDEFFTAAKYYNPGTKSIDAKPAAATVIVVETTIPFDNPIALEARVSAHQHVIRRYKSLWSMAMASAATPR